MKAKGIFISLLIFWSFSMMAQVVSVRSELSCDTISIGEQLSYEFTVETGKETNSEFPTFYDTISSELEIIDRVSIDTTYLNENKIITGKYLVTSFEKGDNIITPKQVLFSYNGQVDTAYSLPLSFTVIAPDVDTTLAIKPIKPPVNTPVSFKEMLPWLLIGLGGLAVLAIFIYLIWYFRKRKTNPELFQSKPREPAHIVALRNLDQLKNDKLMESALVKKYYSRLTEIIRIYIADQYGLQAMESTSAEIMEEFKLMNRENVNLNDMLDDLLQLADLVKFAKEDPLRKEREQHMNDAYNFVNETYSIIEEAMEREQEQEDNSEEVRKTKREQFGEDRSSEEILKDNKEVE